MAGASVMKDREQHSRRRAMRKQDHAGRVWHCTVDVEDEFSGHCAVPTLDGQYRPQIDIPLKYMKKVDRNDSFRMLIDFAKWKADWRERMIEWRARLQTIAKAMYPNDWGAHMEHPTPAMLEEAGPRPIPLEFIEACEVGNKWALGIPKPDGTYYPRPKWATDDLWAQYQLLRQSFWRVDSDAGFGTPDPSKYADEEDEAEPTVVEATGTAYEDEDEPTPRRKGKRAA